MQRPHSSSINSASNHTRSLKPKSAINKTWSSEYVSALSVFQDEKLLTQLCNLFHSSIQREEDSSSNDKDASNGNEKARDDSSRKQLLDIYSKCHSASTTIAQIEESPGFIQQMKQKQHLKKQSRTLSSHGRPTLPPALSGRNVSTSGAIGLKPKSGVFRRGSHLGGPLGASSHMMERPTTLKRNNSTSSTASSMSVSGFGKISNSPPPPGRGEAQPPPNVARFLAALNNPNAALASKSAGAGGGKSPAPKKNRRLSIAGSGAGIGNALKRRKAATTRLDDPLHKRGTTTATKKNPTTSTSKRGKDSSEEEYQSGSDESSSSSSSGEEEVMEENSGQVATTTSGSSNTMNPKESNAAERITPRRNTKRSTNVIDTSTVSFKKRTQSNISSPKRKEPRRKSSRISAETPNLKNTVNQEETPNYNYYDIGDEVAVYFEKDDQWYEAMIRDILYKETPLSPKPTSTRSSRMAKRPRGENVEDCDKSKTKDTGSLRRNAAYNGSTTLRVSSYTVEYGNGEIQENVSPDNVLDRMDDHTSSDLDD